jgi:putative component of toxin-antitoxin plasmid stabilization module
MLELNETETFRRWLLRMKDRRTRALIASRLDRLAVISSVRCALARRRRLLAAALAI